MSLLSGSPSEWWERKFPDKTEISWRDFIREYKSSLLVDAPEAIIEPPLQIAFNKVPQNLDSETVSKSSFMLFDARFKPLENSHGNARALVAPWFHGSAAKEACQSEFERVGYHPGSFLVRFSERFPQYFAVMYVDKSATSSAPIKSILVENGGPNVGYRAQGQQGTAGRIIHKTLADFIAANDDVFVTPIVSTLFTNYIARYGYGLGLVVTAAAAPNANSPTHMRNESIDLDADVDAGVVKSRSGSLLDLSPNSSMKSMKRVVSRSLLRSSSEEGRAAADVNTNTSPIHTTSAAATSATQWSNLPDAIRLATSASVSATINSCNGSKASSPFGNSNSVGEGLSGFSKMSKRVLSHHALSALGLSGAVGASQLDADGINLDPEQQQQQQARMMISKKLNSARLKLDGALQNKRAAYSEQTEIDNDFANTSTHSNASRGSEISGSSGKVWLMRDNGDRVVETELRQCLRLCDEVLCDLSQMEVGISAAAGAVLTNTHGDVRRSQESVESPKRTVRFEPTTSNTAEERLKAVQTIADTSSTSIPDTVQPVASQSEAVPKATSGLMFGSKAPVEATQNAADNQLDGTLPAPTVTGASDHTASTLAPSPSATLRLQLQLPEKIQRAHSYDEPGTGSAHSSHGDDGTINMSRLPPVAWMCKQRASALATKGDALLGLLDMAHSQEAQQTLSPHRADLMAQSLQTLLQSADIIWAFYERVEHQSTFHVYKNSSNSNSGKNLLREVEIESERRLQTTSGDMPAEDQLEFPDELGLLLKKVQKQISWLLGVLVAATTAPLQSSVNATPSDAMPTKDENTTMSLSQVAKDVLLAVLQLKSLTPECLLDIVEEHLEKFVIATSLSLYSDPRSLRGVSEVKIKSSLNTLDIRTVASFDNGFSTAFSSFSPNSSAPCSPFTVSASPSAQSLSLSATMATATAVATMSSAGIQGPERPNNVLSSPTSPMPLSPGFQSSTAVGGVRQYIHRATRSISVGYGSSVGLSSSIINGSIGWLDGASASVSTTATVGEATLRQLVRLRCILPSVARYDGNECVGVGDMPVDAHIQPTPLEALQAATALYKTDRKRAEVELSKALRAARLCADLETEMRATANLATIAKDQGHMERAAVLYRRAAGLCRRLALQTAKVEQLLQQRGTAKGTFTPPNSARTPSSSSKKSKFGSSSFDGGGSGTMAGFSGREGVGGDVSLFADISREDEQMLSYCNPSMVADKEKLSNLERNFMLSLANILLQLQFYDSAIVVARDLLRSVQVLENVKKIDGLIKLATSKKAQQEQQQHAKGGY